NSLLGEIVKSSFDNFEIERIATMESATFCIPNKRYVSPITKIYTIVKNALLRYLLFFISLLLS
ncbi:MAG: hypothetical protein ACRDCB_04885, partial [Clostridium sp.]